MNSRAGGNGRDDAARKRLAAAMASAETGDFSTLGVVVDALGSVDDGVRIKAADACASIGCAVAIGALSRMAAADPVSDNRGQAICALQAIGRPAGVPALVAALGDKDDERREDARTALYRVLGRGVLPFLADEIDGPDARERERERFETLWREHGAALDPALAYAFGEPATPGAYVAELMAVKSGLPDAALHALFNWTGEDFGRSPLSRVKARWQAWWQHNAGRYEPGRRTFRGRRVPD